MKKNFGLPRLPLSYCLGLALLILLAAVGTSLRLRQLAVPAAAIEPQATVFVVDAGHGGVDGGASTATGVAESGLNLQIALRLDALLQLLGQKTVMIRTEDISLHDADALTYSAKKVSDLHNRAAIVNETPNALLISIHQNQFGETKYSGAQVFYNTYPPAQELAQKLQASLSAALDPNNHRTAKSASDTVYLMRAVQTPALLIECGFLSNPAEAELLQQPAYQLKLALVIANTLTGSVQGDSSQHEV